MKMFNVACAFAFATIQVVAFAMASPASAQESIVIGMFAPTTGGAAEAGMEMVNSATLAVEEVNAGNVIPGKRFVLRVYDTQMQPSATAQAAQRALVVDKANILVGGYSSTEGVTLKQIAEQNKAIYIASLPGVPEVTEGAKYTFRVAPLADDYGTVQVSVLQALDKKRPALLHDNSAYGLGIAPGLLRKITDAGIPTSGPAVEYPINSTDMSTIIAKVKAQNPDSLAWIGASPSDAGLIAKTMVEQGLLIPVTAVAVATFADAIRVAGDAYDKLPGVYAPKNRDASKPAYQDFIKKYVAKFGGDEKVVGGKIGDAAAQTYDSIKILAKVLAGNGGNTDSDSIAGALVAMPPYDGASGCADCKIDFSKSHNGFENSMIAHRMEKGTPVLAPEIRRN